MKKQKTPDKLKMVLSVDSTEVLLKADLEKKIEELEVRLEKHHKISEEDIILLTDRIWVLIQNESPTVIEEATIPIKELKEAFENNLPHDELEEWAEHLQEHYLEEKPPLRASDYKINNYEFRRKICDIFEVGYHVPTHELFRLLAERIGEKEWVTVF